MKVIGGISGPCKIVYDQRYKDKQKSESLSGHNSVVHMLVRAEPDKEHVAEGVRCTAA